MIFCYIFKDCCHRFLHTTLRFNTDHRASVWTIRVWTSIFGEDGFLFSSWVSCPWRWWGWYWFIWCLLKKGWKHIQCSPFITHFVITQITFNIDTFWLPKFFIIEFYKGIVMVSCLFVLILYVPVNNFSVMLGWVFLGWTSTKQTIKCLAQGHNAVPPPLLRSFSCNAFVNCPFII